MIVKESDVTTKGCVLGPAARPACIGRACMAWRWATPLFGPPEQIAQKEGAITKIVEHRPKIIRGYCGLASIPERSEP